MTNDLNNRSLDIFRHVVDAFVETGEPVGSRTLSKRLGMNISPATIRNVMADLEELGLLYAPHTSAGRLPTDAGLRFYVNGLLENGSLSDDERKNIDESCNLSGRNIEDVLNEATAALSGLTQCAGLVMAPKKEIPIKHFEFVYLNAGRALLVLVNEGGVVENRVLEIPLDISPSLLVEASNFLNAKLSGRTLVEAKTILEQEINNEQAFLDVMTQNLIGSGLAQWAGGDKDSALIVRGQSNLLRDVHGNDDIERMRHLFAALDTKAGLVELLDSAIVAEGVQIFIGSETPLFQSSGCSAIVSPYTDRKGQIIGALGVIGPSRMNYAKIISLVDYTAKVVSRLIG